MKWSLGDDCDNWACFDCSEVIAGKVVKGENDKFFSAIFFLSGGQELSLAYRSRKMAKELVESILRHKLSEKKELDID